MESMLQTLIQNVSPENIIRYFKSKISSFREIRDSFDYVLKEADFERFSHLQKLGEAEYSNSDELIIFSCLYRGNLTERSSKKQQYEIAKKVLREDFKDGAIFVFYDNDSKFRFSFIRKNYGDTSGKYTTWRRYTYFIEPDKLNKTFCSRFENCRFDSLESIQEAFSVEALSNQFYKELFDWYQWALSDTDGFEVTYPNDTSTESDDRMVEEHLIRLITRLMFVWFIKQKNLVPHEIFSVEYLRRLLKNFDPQSKKSGNYYNAVLQNLFFACLNKAIEERDFARDGQHNDRKEHYGIKSLFRNPVGDTWFAVSNAEVLKLFSVVPFLNGGLFECLDKEIDDSKKVMYYDGFSREAGRQQRAFVPNCLFFDAEKGLIPLLERYNFTIEENSETEVEVALDPELLGNVFENLLGAYNPETKETARKQSGSFYTPREIVGFMVDQSLLAHVRNHCPEIDENHLQWLFTEENQPGDISMLHRLKISEALKSAKILDSACGSGAFPMGVLNRTVHLLQKLDDEESHKAYQLKLHLIENCIYGSDIQTIAVQICKLRFFISLVCEQTPNTDVSGNYGITPLPNLETKFVAANSLIGLEKDISHSLDLGFAEIRALKEQLWEIRRKHFSARNANEKNELRQRDKVLRKQIEKLLVKLSGEPDPQRIALLMAEIEALNTEKQSYAGENWVPMVQPDGQQISMFDFGNEKPQQVLQYDKNKAERERIDKIIREKQKELDKEKNKTLATGFEQEAAQLAAWNPYDQNTTSPFFDAAWMFDVADGFDVVIGNPPYVQLQKIKHSSRLLQTRGYATYEATGDLYCLFYEQGMNLLKHMGMLCYITSNKWMRAAYGKSLRRFFAEKNPRVLIDMGPGVFKAATVDTNILLVENSKPTAHSLQAHTLLNKDKLKTLSACDFSLMQSLDSDSWIILKPEEESIKEKIEKAGKPLKEWDVKIYFGIKTGYNEAFIIDGNTKDELIRQDPKSAEIIKPILRGRDIQRYKAEFADLWLINTHNGYVKSDGVRIPAVDVSKYSAIKAHLDTHWDKIEPRCDQGYTPYNLRHCAYLEEFEKEKIIWKRIGSVIRFSYSSGVEFCLDSTVIMTGEKMKYLCVLLNSKLFIRELLKNSPKTGTGDVIISVQALEPLKLAIASEDAEKKFISLFDQIDRKLSNNQSIHEEEKQADLLVYKLYGLSYSEVLVVDPDFWMNEEEYEGVEVL